MERTYAEKKKIFKDYRRKFGGQPFDFMHTEPEYEKEMFDLMEASVESGKPVDEADIDRINPYQGDGKTFIT